MPLIKYGQFLTYPDGSPAANITVAVNLLGGNVLVPLFSDKVGTIPLTNPVMTDGDGLATFYAAPGAFTTDIAGTLFHYPVDDTETDPAWPGTFIHTQSTPSATWTVNHHFGIKPEVDVLVAGQLAEADVSHTNNETTVITFGAPVTGTAHLRR